MRGVSTTILSEKDFRAKVKCLINNKATFSVKITREKNMYLYSEMDALLARSLKGRATEKVLPQLPEGASIFGSNISFSQGLAIVTMVKQNVKAYIKKADKVEEIKSTYSTVGKNHNAYTEIKQGEAFYSVDINHAYFQVLHKLGYIEDALYNMYKDQDEYKKAFHFSCSWLASRAKIYKYKRGILVDIVDTSETDRELKIIYDNVRHTLQNLLGEIYERLDNAAIGYLTDEILIRQDALPMVKEYFRSKGYEFKITLCWKTSNVEYNKANKKSYKLFGRNSVQHQDNNAGAATTVAKQDVVSSEKFKALIKRKQLEMRT